MSYTYLQEQGAESSVESFLDIPACVLSRLNLIAAKSYSSGNGTESYRSSQYGTMLEPSMERRGEDLSMSSVVDFRAKTLQLEVRPKQELTENEAGFGSRWHEWFAKLDRDMSGWKTQQLSLLEGLDEFSETWPRWGMMHAGASFRLEMLEHDTSVKGCLCLPTITASWAGRGPGLSNNLDNLRMSEMATKRCFVIVSKLGWRWPANILEWVMGWPISWTELAPLATDKFRLWFNSHGRS